MDWHFLPALVLSILYIYQNHQGTTMPSISHLRSLFFAMLLLISGGVVATTGASASQKAVQGSYQELLELLDDFLEFRDPQGR